MLSSIYQYAERNWFPVTIGIFLFPFFCIAFGALGFLLGLPLTKWHGVLAFLLSQLAVWKLTQFRENKKINVFLSTLLLVLTFCCGAFSTEMTVDGQIYHKPAGISLAYGWNPVWNENLQQFLINKGFSPHELNLSHAWHFPKGQAIIVAVMYLMTGNINAGDSSNYIFLITLFIISYYSLKAWLPISKFENFLTSFLLVCNPISLGCLNTGLIDGLLGMSIGILVLSTIAWLKTDDNRWVYFIILSAVMGIQFKFTGPIYILIIGFVFTIPYVSIWIFQKIKKDASMTIYLVSYRKWRKTLYAIFFLSCILGFHPYLTNWRYYSSPFYPIHSFNEKLFPKLDILKDYNNHTADIKAATPFQKFVFSHILGQPFNYSEIYSDEYSPYKMSSICAFPSHSCYPTILFNVFGWIFGLSIIASSILLFFLRRLDMWLVVIGLILSVIIQPHSWWGRFVPQLWFIPILVFCFIRCQTKNIFEYSFNFKIVTLFFMLSLFAQSCFVLLHNSASIVGNAILETKFLEKVEQHPGGNIVSAEIYQNNYSFLTKSLKNNSCSKFYNKEYSRSLNLPIQSNQTINENRALREIIVARFSYHIYLAPDISPSLNFTDDAIELDKNDIEISTAFKSLYKLAIIRTKQLRRAWITL